MKRFLMFVVVLLLPGGFFFALYHLFFGDKFDSRNFFTQGRGGVKISLQSSRGCGKLCTLS